MPRSTRNRHNRIEGRRGQALRIARLQREPLCRLCLNNGRTTEATVPDHINPLALGGTDTDNNIRCLCADCHRDMTAMQFGKRTKPRTGTDGWPM